jgi:osmoprotectant transport system permease protein
MSRLHPFLILFLAGCAPAVVPLSERPIVRVGSKVFTESVILGDIVAGLAASAGADARHTQTRALGSTRVLWEALSAGEVDVYVEYTGTIGQEILAGRGLKDEDAIRGALEVMGIRMSRSLGFNNTYAIGMAENRAEHLKIVKLSDLTHHPELRFGFSNEFMDRADGWKGLRERYRLPQRDVRGLDHELAYRGLVEGSLDATDLYSTDAKIRRYHLRVLQDDLGYFPAYHAVLVYRDDLARRAPQVERELLMLQGSITEATMIDMNAKVDLDRMKESQVAAEFLRQRFGIQAETADEGLSGILLVATYQHLFLVGVSLLAAIVVSIPLGILAARRPVFGQVILAASGLVQTIPSLALLVFMIPLLGLFAPPAIAALFLYSLLPIVRNTYSGLREIPLHVRESAEALGLSAFARLRLVELPLASGMILAGIKTAAVINVGTATLGGFIGAGGYGQLIFSGLRKGDNALTLEGAVPAALLALGVQGMFELAERFLVPRGLRLKRID